MYKQRGCELEDSDLSWIETCSYRLENANSELEIVCNL